MVDVWLTFNNNNWRPTSTVLFSPVLNGTVLNQWREVRLLSNQQPWLATDSKLLIGQQPLHKKMQHRISKHRSKWCSDSSCCFFVELNRDICCQCRCSLILFIFEGDFICLSCWQGDAYNAICLCHLSSPAYISCLTYMEGTRVMVIKVARTHEEETLAKEL